MNRKTIQETLDKRLCCSCGICAGICSKGCIRMSVDNNGRLLPTLDSSLCVECGICYNVCPGKDAIKERPTSKAELIGELKGQWTAHVKDDKHLLQTASGGICTWLIKQLLDTNLYDAAFVVDTFNYSTYVKTEHLSDLENIDKVGRSRYIPVSQENAAWFMIKNKAKRVILVGTSCAVRGFRNVIEHYHLDSSNYLLIGLFCDKMMNYHVWDYFANKQNSASGKLNSLFFRSKEKNGWPGDMKLAFEHDNLFLEKRERIAVKDFFCNERCLYCMDKLNIYSDIALGDNYTGKYGFRMGSSNVLIRTSHGEKAIKSVDLSQLKQYELNIEEVWRSQEVGKKRENGYFLSVLLHENRTIPIKIRLKYHYKRLKICCGDNYHRFPLLMNVWKALESSIKKYE